MFTLDLSRRDMREFAEQNSCGSMVLRRATVCYARAADGTVTTSDSMSPRVASIAQVGPGSGTHAI